MSQTPQNPTCSESILAAIPWYPNGLTAEERGAVESHAADCRSCRAELAFLRGDEEPSLELPDAEALYARVLTRIDAYEEGMAAWAAVMPQPRVGSRMLSRARSVRRRLVQPVGVAAGLLVAVMSGMLTVGVIWVAREAPSQARYQPATLSEPAVAAGAIELQIVFRPDATAQEIQAALHAAGASLSSGPSARGVYRALLPPGSDVEAALERLRGAGEEGHGVAKFAERPTGS